MTNRKILYTPIPPEIERLVREHGGTREDVLEILRDLDRSGELDQTTIVDVARSVGMVPHQVFGIATFYSMLSLQKRKKVIRVCDGPVCSLKKSAGLKQELSDAADDNWSIERSSCLGLCDRAPAALVEDEQAGPLSFDGIQKLFEGWRGDVPDY